MLNKIFLIGRIGKDVVVKHFENGGKIAEFTLATDDSYKNKQGEKVEQTDWHNIKINAPKLAEVAEKYLKKGSLVHIEGKAKTRSYDDKNGEKRYVTEVVVEGFKMLDKKESDSGSSHWSTPSHASVNEEDPATTSAPEDSLPF